MEASSSSILVEWLAQMQAAFPGYNPSAANLEYVQAQIFASFAADIASLCGEGATELFRTYATDLVGIPYQQGVAATAVVTIQAQTVTSSIATTTQGLTIGGGPIVSIPVAALPYGIAAGTITLSDPSLAHSQTWTTSGANAGDTSIPVSSQTPNFNYPLGSEITGTQEYVLSALSQFDLDGLGFSNLAEADFQSGTSQSVTLTAVQAGTAFNGAGQAGGVAPVQETPWIAEISVSTSATGGVDPEDDTHYLNRVKAQLQLQAPRPVTAVDFGTMALSFNPYPGTNQQEVGRATAIDGYNPADGTTGNARMVAVAAVDANGFSLNNDTLYGYPGGTSSNIITTVPNPTSGWGIAGWLQSLREITFVVNVIQPTYSPIYVTATIQAQVGWDVASVQSNVQATLLAFLNPQTWGVPPATQSGWTNTTSIHQSDLLATIQRSAGVLYVLPGTLKFGLAPSPTNVGDLALPGAVPLPTSSTTTIPTSAFTIQT